MGSPVDAGERDAERGVAAERSAGATAATAATPPPPPPPPPKSVIEMSSMLIRLLPPSSLRISKRTVPARLTVNVAVENELPVVDREVPTWVHVLPPFCDENSPQVPLASEPKLAWWSVTVPAPVVRSNRIVMRPLLRIRPDCVPVLTSVLKVPISASLRFHVPGRARRRPPRRRSWCRPRSPRWW